MQTFVTKKNIFLAMIFHKAAIQFKINIVNLPYKVIIYTKYKKSWQCTSLI